MSQGQLLVAGTMLCSFIVTANVGAQDRREIPKYSARAFYETTTFLGASFSADEAKLLITSDASGVFNAYSQATKGGTPTPLTQSKTSAVFGESYFPADDRILYIQDEGGNELHHVYVRETDGKVRDLTPGKGHKASFAGWSGDLKHFYVTSNERDAHFFDLYRYDTTSYERSLVFKNTDGFSSPRASRDGHRVALLKTRTNADNDIYLWEAGQPDKEPLKITPHEGDVEHNIQTFSPDSRTLYYSSNLGSEFQRVWAYDLKTGARKAVVEDNWDVMSVSFSWEGRFRVVSVNADARTVTTVTDTKTRQPLQFPESNRANINGVAFARSEDLMAFYVSSDTSPADLVLMDLRTGAHRKLTKSLNPEIEQEVLVPSAVVHYPSYDKLSIPALLYKPRGASPEHKAPALV